MKKRELNPKLKFRKETESNLKNIKGGIDTIIAPFDTLAPADTMR